jgi:transposase
MHHRSKLALRLNHVFERSGRRIMGRSRAAVTPERYHRDAGGRQRKHEFRRVVDALLYVVKTGCQWRQLPETFLPGSMSNSAAGWIPESRNAWVRRCVSGAVGRLGAKRHQLWRLSIRNRPSHWKRGTRSYDASKNIKARKRQFPVDTQGNLLIVIVHSAGTQDRIGARGAPC